MPAYPDLSDQIQNLSGDAARLLLVLLTSDDVISLQGRYTVGREVLCSPTAKETTYTLPTMQKEAAEKINALF